MRAVGSTVAGGTHAPTDLGLPREEREPREAARARLEAKRARLAAQSPFAAARAAEATDPALAAAATAVRSPAPAPRPKPALSARPVPSAPAPKAATAPRLDAERATAHEAAQAPTSAELLSARRVDAAGIVQDYLAGDTVPTIAERRGHSTATVRRVLRETPGLELRDDRATHSGSAPKVDDPLLVERVRTLYDGGKTQVEVAEALGLTPKIIQGIMARNEIKGRPAPSAPPKGLGAEGATILHDDITAAGLTARSLRAWARTHHVPVSTQGTPPRRVFNAYLAWQAAGSPDPVDPAPEPPVEPHTDGEHTPIPVQDEPSAPELDIPDLTGLAAASARADSIPTPTRTAGPLDAILQVAASRSTVNHPDAPYIPHALANLDRATALADPLRQLGKALAALGGIAADVATAIDALSRAAAQARDLAYPPDTPAEQAARRRALAAESRRRTR